MGLFWVLGALPGALVSLLTALPLLTDDAVLFALLLVAVALVEALEVVDARSLWSWEACAAFV